MKQSKIIVLLILVHLGIYAQEEFPQRKGFSIGASIGVGALHFTSGFENADTETQGGISLPNLKIGWLLNNRLAIYLNTPGQIYEKDGRDRSFEGYIPSIQYWASNRWWISGGFGLALDSPALYESRKKSLEKNNWGKGVLLGSGFEITQRKKWALDLQIQVYMASVKLKSGEQREGTDFALGLGFTFF